jgi:hypothetical protein
MTEPIPVRNALAALVLATTLGCATGTPPAPPAPSAAGIRAEPAIVLEPTPAERRAAESIRLTGDEMGRMWTFEDPPLDRWKTAYDFSPDREWLDRVQRSSLRFGEYCSAAFVSPDGLAITNQHCARECAESVSSGRTDHVADGFVARDRREERLCPGLFVDQLVDTDDVTGLMRQALPESGLPAVERVRAEREAAAKIEDECEEKSWQAHCQVVSLYEGARYTLYRYRRFDTVKLVFTPELQVAYFGGEHDNFTYPRYALDAALVRVYDGDSPAETDDAYLPLDPAGAEEDEAVFVAGNPGSTSRTLTVAELLYEREYRLPLRVWVLNQQLRLLQTYAATDPELDEVLRQDRFEVSNGLKAYSGMLAGLRDTTLAGTRLRMERELRSRIEARPELQREYGDVFDRLAALQQKKLGVSPRLNAANASLFGSTHLELALTLVDFVRQAALPEEERSPRFRGETGRELAMDLASGAWVDPSIAWQTVSGHLHFLERWLPADDPLRSLLLRPGEAVEDATGRLLSETGILDAEFRARILEEGIEAVDASTDPFITFARVALEESQRLWRDWEELVAEETVQRRRLGQVLCAVYGTAIPSDATFTLRIADGVVKRYPYNGTLAPAFTTFYGLYARAAEFGAEPWALPASFVRARARVDMETPLNFVATTDITGGNSGSPVIDTAGRLVGVVFDSNMEMLPNDYLYRSGSGRTVAVHAAAILEALRNVYDASGLVAELTGRYGRNRW